MQSQLDLKARQTISENLGDVSTAKWYLERKREDEFSLRHDIQQTELVDSEYIKALRRRTAN